MIEYAEVSGEYINICTEDGKTNSYLIEEVYELMSGGLASFISLYRACIVNLTVEELDKIATEINAVAVVLGEPEYSDTHGL